MTTTNDKKKIKIFFLDYAPKNEEETSPLSTSPQQNDMVVSIINGVKQKNNNCSILCKKEFFFKKAIPNFLKQDTDKTTDFATEKKEYEELASEALKIIDYADIVVVLGKQTLEALTRIDFLFKKNETENNIFGFGEFKADFMIIFHPAYIFSVKKQYASKYISYAVEQIDKIIKLRN